MVKPPAVAAAAAFLTRSEFAALKGWQPSYVTKLIAQRRLVLSRDGKKIDVAASERRLEETRRVDRQGVREHHARSRRKNVEPGPLQGPPTPAAPRGLDSGAAGEGGAQPPKADATQDEYNRARAQKEAAQAEMAALELKRRQGELVEIGQVRDAAARIAGIVARGFERIAPRIGPVWSVEQDPAKREQLLEDELRKVQHEFADEVEKLMGGANA